MRRAGHSDGIVTRHQLWHINDQLEPVKEELEEEAVRLGWLARMPSPLINRWSGIGIAELVVGGILVVLGYVIPMSGLTLLGFALGVGGIGTIAFGHAMSQRTKEGAYVDAMLKAYRRTLQKTLEQARDMNQVVQDPQIRTLADTPDKAVVWGIALGLHQEVAQVLERSLADLREGVAGAGAGGYYPDLAGQRGLVQPVQWRRIRIGRWRWRPLLRLGHAGHRRHVRLAGQHRLQPGVQLLIVGRRRLWRRRRRRRRRRQQRVLIRRRYSGLRSGAPRTERLRFAR